LTTLERRIELIGRIAPEIRVVVQQFTLELSRLSARAFVEQLLLGELGARVVLVGKNFRFGHGREGDVPLLERLGSELGFDAVSTDLVADERGPLSSSRIRKAILAGDLAEAELVLGRPHALAGAVVRGDGRGRTIGVPTANLAPEEQILPANGVYAARCRTGAGAWHAAAVNVGERPTFGGGRVRLEAHLLDFEGDLYGARLRVAFHERLRGEQRFDGMDALVAQIRRDIEAVRARLPPPGGGAV